jgi:hypothetical protein
MLDVNGPGEPGLIELKLKILVLDMPDVNGSGGPGLIELKLCKRISLVLVCEGSLCPRKDA